MQRKLKIVTCTSANSTMDGSVASWCTGVPLNTINGCTCLEWNCSNTIWYLPSAAPHLYLSQRRIFMDPQTLSNRIQVRALSWAFPPGDIILYKETLGALLVCFRFVAWRITGFTPPTNYTSIGGTVGWEAQRPYWVGNQWFPSP